VKSHFMHTLMTRSRHLHNLNLSLPEKQPCRDTITTHLPDIKANLSDTLCPRHFMNIDIWY